LKTLSLAVRNLTRQKKRSFTLAGAVAFGFFIVTLVDGLATGAVDNMCRLFDNLFGGNVIVAATERLENGSTVDVTRNSEMLLDLVNSTGIEYIDYNKRSMSSGYLIYEGEKLITNLFGCDFNQEQSLLDSMTFVSGDLEKIPENGLIINESIAESLNIQVGEVLLYSTETVTGQATFGEFVIGGITKDLSMLSAISCYANMYYLNELIGLKPDEFSSYQFMMKNSQMQAIGANAVEDALRAKGLQVTDRRTAVAQKPDNPWGAIADQIEGSSWTGTLYTVFCMNDQMAFASQLSSVVQAVSTGVLFAIMLIVMIGISNTYKMILFERIREVGTMRALGMNRKQTSAIFRWEATLLSIFGAVVGLLLGILFMVLLGLPTFNVEELGMFLLNGHTSWRLVPVSIIIKFAVMIIMTLLAVQGSAKSAAKMKPADALRTSK
jgi:putative ABC transport system permease protein